MTYKQVYMRMMKVAGLLKERKLNKKAGAFRDDIERRKFWHLNGYTHTGVLPITYDSVNPHSNLLELAERGPFSRSMGIISDSFKRLPVETQKAAFPYIARYFDGKERHAKYKPKRFVPGSGQRVTYKEQYPEFFGQDD